MTPHATSAGEAVRKWRSKAPNTDERSKSKDPEPRAGLLTFPCAAAAPPAASRSMCPAPGPARAPQCVTPAAAMAANLVESSRGNKESVLRAESYRGGAPRTKICPSSWPVASGRPTNQPGQAKRGNTKQSNKAKAQSTLLLVPPPPSSSFPQAPPRPTQSYLARPHAGRASY